MVEPFYFAYGSHMQDSDREMNFRRIGISDPVERIEHVAYLTDHQRVFDRLSVQRGGGVLNLRPKKGAIVFGGLYRLHSNGWAALDAQFASDSGYARTTVRVRTLDGQPLDAVTYLAPRQWPNDFFSPTQEYLDQVSDAMGTLGLEDVDLILASKGDRNAGLLDSLFVYDSVMRGMERHSLLRATQKVNMILLAQTQGALFDLGDSPALSLLTEWSEERQVRGEWAELSDPEGTLSTLDEAEGFHTAGDDRNLLERICIEADLGDGEVKPAWAYVLARGPSMLSRLDSGDWRQVLGRKDEFLLVLARAHFGHAGPGLISRLQQEQGVFVKNAEELARSLSEGQISEFNLARVTSSWKTCCG